MRYVLIVLLLLTAVSIARAEDSPAVQAAKRERERRAKLSLGRTFTNKDIQEYVAKHPSIPASAASTSSEPETQTQTAEATVDESSVEFWQAKHLLVVQRISVAQAKIDEIQNDINTLTKAFYEVVDENKKVEINDVRNKKLEDLETAKTELQQANQAQDDLEEEARLAGIPPGWVRD
jgi:hypothetical protein